MTRIFGGTGSAAVFWQTQLPVDFIDTSLTINDWSEVSADLSSGRPARLWYIIVEQTNNGATAETVELELTINGTAETITFTNAASGDRYFAYPHITLTAGARTWLTATANVVTPAGSYTDADQAVPFDARSVGLVRVRQTTDVDGTSAQIEVNIVWEKLQGL